jgi:hypothetical protein
MGYAELIGAIASMIGGAKASADQREDKNKAQSVLSDVLARYGAIQSPTLKDTSAEELGPSQLASIRDDPTLKDAELNSLNGLQDIQNSGGLTLADRASLNDTLNATARRESAGRASIANDFAARGQLGSGAQLAMSLQNQQDSANRGAEAGLNTAANAQKRYFESILQRGKMAGEMDDRQYSRKAAAAQAADSIAAHNAAARTDAARYNNGLANQRFSNDMSKANGMSGGGYQLANFISNEGDRKAAQTAGIATGAGHAISAFGNSQGTDSGYTPAYAGQVDDEDYLKRARVSGPSYSSYFDEET